MNVNWKLVNQDTNLVIVVIKILLKKRLILQIFFYILNYYTKVEGKFYL